MNGTKQVQDINSQNIANCIIVKTMSKLPAHNQQKIEEYICIKQTKKSLNK
jgi:hypothetical protein